MKIKFEKSDFAGNTYSSTNDCPIFRALKRAGCDVWGVGGDGWRDNSRVFHRFNDELNDISVELSGGDIFDEKLQAWRWNTDIVHGIVGKEVEI